LRFVLRESYTVKKLYGSSDRESREEEEEEEKGEGGGMTIDY